MEMAEPLTRLWAKARRITSFAVAFLFRHHWAKVQTLILTDPSFAHLKSAQAPCFGEECIHALWKGHGLHEKIERLQQSHIMSGSLPGCGHT